MSRLRLLALCLLIPWSASAQTPGVVPRIGLLDAGSLAGRAPLWEAFRQGMRELGYVEGRTVIFEARGTDGHYERLPALLDELVRLKVNVIVTASTTAAEAASQATATTAIVMASGEWPAGKGVVASLARPGGNMTGLTSLNVTLSAKRLELARGPVPGASRFAILETGSPSVARQIRETEAAAGVLGVRVHAVVARDPVEFDDAFSRSRGNVLRSFSLPPSPCSSASAGAWRSSP